VASFRAARRLAGYLAAPHYLLTRTRALELHALVRLGELDRAQRILASLDEEDLGRGEMRVITAKLRLVQGDPDAATAALAPLVDGSVPVGSWTWLIHAFLLEAVARDALGDDAAAGQALERALDLAEPDAVAAFFIHPAPELLKHHARGCARHASLIGEILGQLAAGTDTSAGDARAGSLERRSSRAGAPLRTNEPLSQSELRVLRYLPTNLTGPEIARELSVSLTTVRTHVRHIFAKLDAHRRAEAVARARDLGLLAPSAHGT
jgi:LuxR family maltose regulon positive regulatory protein